MLLARLFILFGGLGLKLDVARLSIQESDSGLTRRSIQQNTLETGDFVMNRSGGNTVSVKERKDKGSLANALLDQSSND